MTYAQWVLYRGYKHIPWYEDEPEECGQDLPNLKEAVKTTDIAENATTDALTEGK